MVVLFVVAFLLVCLIVDAVIQYKKRKEAAVSTAASLKQTVLGENSFIIPKGIFFDKGHSWAFMDQYGIVRTGINDFLQHITGTITSVKLNNVGDIIKKGDLLLSIIQDGKKLNIYSPVSGKIRAYNSELEKNSSIINSSPYTDGWVYDIEPEKWLTETKFMFIAEKANAWFKSEIQRFKEFITSLQTNNLQLSNVVMQDGGEIIDNVLSELGPEIWEEFQTGFIDKK